MSEQTRCPEARDTGGYYPELDEYITGADMCNLVDKWCLLESGDTCAFYDDFLEEEKRELLTEKLQEEYRKEAK